MDCADALALNEDVTVIVVLLTIEFTVRISLFTAILVPTVNTPLVLAILNLVFVPVTTIEPDEILTVPPKPLVEDETILELLEKLLDKVYSE